MHTQKNVELSALITNDRQVRGAEMDSRAGLTHASGTVHMKQRSGMHRRVIKARGAISCRLVFLFALFCEVKDGRAEYAVAVCRFTSKHSMHTKVANSYVITTRRRWTSGCGAAACGIYICPCILVYLHTPDATVEFIRVFICVESKKNGSVPLQVRA
jgi:hypothetical protein